MHRIPAETRRALVVLAFLVLVIPSAFGQSAKRWLGHEQEYEEALRNGAILSEEPIGTGVTKPTRLEVRMGSEIIRAVWKPLLPSRRGGYWESYGSEVAAYEIDKLLQLGMVPPTVTRKVSGRLGSVQLWVEDARLYRDVEDTAPTSVHWSHELSRMKMFDNLIYNADRNAQNFMVDREWNIILIDHSRAFTTRKKLLPENHQRPVQFDRKIVSRLRGQDPADIDAILGELIMRAQKKALHARRDALLGYIQELIEQRGESRVLF